MSWFSDLEHRINTSIFQYRSPSIGLANLGHTMESRYTVAKGGLTVAGLALGGMGVARVASATKPVRVGLSWIRHPVANYAKLYGGKYTARAASAYLATSKGVRYVGYAAFVADPLVTYHYFRKGEYDKAVVSHFGPPGAVYIYGKLVSNDDDFIIKQPEVVKSKRTKMSEKQRMRLWRMGLRWCKRHKRYDRCKK